MDVNTPKLDRIVIEGTLIVSDDSDINITTKYLIIREGKLIIGTKEKPKNHRVVITFWGN